MIKTVGDIRKAIDGLPDEMQVGLFVFCEPMWNDAYPPHGYATLKVNDYYAVRAFLDYSQVKRLDLKVSHFCPDAYVNQNGEGDDD